MPISRRLRHALLTRLPAAAREALAAAVLDPTVAREALAADLLGLPRVPHPIAGGGTLMVANVKVSAVGGSSVTCITDAQYGEPHPSHFRLSGSGIVVGTIGAPVAADWGSAASAYKFLATFARVT